MLKKTITYHDLDDNEITEDFWFNLSQAELSEMMLSKEGKEGGFQAWVRNIQASNDGQIIVDNFKKILLATVGKRSADNKSFLKSDEIRDAFQYSDAYSVLFMEIVTDGEKMAAFVNGVVPAKLRDQVDQRIETSGLRNGPAAVTPPQAVVAQPQVQTPTPNSLQPPTPDSSASDMPAWFTEGRVPRQEELVGASSELMMEAFRRKSAGGAAENGASS